MNRSCLSPRPWTTLLIALLGISTSGWAWSQENAPPAAGAARQLQWKFVAGARYRVVLKQQTTVTSSVNGRGIPMSFDVETEMLWTIDSVQANGDARIVQSFERMALDLKSQTAPEVRYDSNMEADTLLPAQKELAESIAPLLRAQFVVLMSPRGEIKDLVVPQETAQALNGVKSRRWKSMLTPDGMMGLFGQSSFLLPEKSVTKNDQWENEREVTTSLGKMQLANRFTYEGTVQLGDQSVEKIAVESQLDLSATNSRMKLTEQECGGTIHFSPTEARLSFAAMKQRLVTESDYSGTRLKVELETQQSMDVRPVID